MKRRARARVVRARGAVVAADYDDRSVAVEPRHLRADSRGRRDSEDRVREVPRGGDGGVRDVVSRRLAEVFRGVARHHRVAI
eukprot:15627-Pelagococcus_subviridis.AAC.3